ncbi:volume-regulated anion channel subunit LRRC8B-like isoform X2 [Polyodon spathula]|uniref:volume-regulated anion channel subunit LRRC8B-like isoform X2 n=1 Tax=Polyodon spathula TaxID=7913 RepID=UPI001B7EF12E|nr:volume-regulated anion channel subunit LRRC8B-like isoform X2 [Polyodon spathula]
MLSGSELKHFVSGRSLYHVLQPWWDVFSHHLSIMMLMVAAVGGTLQIAQCKILCVPCQLSSDHGCTPPLDLGTANHSSASYTSTGIPLLTGIINDLDLQQYSYIDAVCYEKQLHWFAKFFPYLVLSQTLIFILVSNFWFKYPSTSSRLVHFVSILRKCCDSPWTTRALSETVAEQNSQRSTLSKYSVLKSSSSMDGDVRPNNLVGIDPIGILDKKEGEQAKAIFEKVKKFKMHVEEKDIIYRLYMNQILAKLMLFFIIMAYIPYVTTCISFDLDCVVDIQAFTGYQRYHCVHSLATIFKMLASFYVVLVIMYGLMCFYSFWWMLRRSLKQYSFESVREGSSYSDIPDLKNDFAFILHLLDQYDPLFSKRFSVFLSEVSENKLKQINLNDTWTAEKLKQKLSRNIQDKVELQLLLLSGIPDAVFELKELEVLKLELIPDARFLLKVTQLVNLKEIWLNHTIATVDFPALSFLSENIKILRLRCTDMDRAPQWMFSLINLRELYLDLPPESNAQFINGLAKLKNLKVLFLKNSIPCIPQVIPCSLSSLQNLSVNNEGTRLTELNNLKMMINLTCLKLVNCDLERIPHSVFSLTDLWEIDLEGNNLKTVEEIISFQHLQRLCTIKLWHNNIAYIPMHIGALESLEQLYLSHNNIDTIPLQLFLCSKLSLLDLSHNSLTFIPDEIHYLKKLQYFAVTNNNVSSLPDGLFQCRMLQSLLLGNNSLSVLPPLVSELVNLVELELSGNQLETLPVELGGCLNLRASGLIVEDCLFRSLPSAMKENWLQSEKEQL